MNQFRTLCSALYDGRITFDDFAAATRERWRKYAEYLARRWRQPAWNAVEDIEQELLLAVWETIWRFDPARANGAAIDKFVAYNALDRAKKACHRARKAKMSRTQDKNASRFEIPFCAFEDEETRAMLEIVVEPEQEKGLVRRASVDDARAACTTEESELAVEAFAIEGSISAAADRLFGDFAIREACGFESTEHAEVFVRTAVTDVVTRLEAA